MRRRSFLTHSAALGVGSALTQFSSLLAPRQVFASTLEGDGTPVTIRSLVDFENVGTDLKAGVVKGLDLSHLDLDFWKQLRVDATHFLGCTFRNKEVEDYLRSMQAYLLPRFDGLAYDAYRTALYTPSELVAVATAGMTMDAVIYKNFMSKGKTSTDLVESLARRVHDFSMDDGLQQLAEEILPTDMVCVTGGFFQDRTDPWFRKTAAMARLLSKDNKFVVTGGGPGIMEAANLGAYLSMYEASALDSALEVLAKAPKWTDRDWADRALEVKEMFPNGTRSLGIPTWFYGFEPTNLFATDIAKYFDNSLREGVLMSIAKGGAVFAPGAAGARQEIFMAATQNHFGSTGHFYPMVLFGKQHYQEDTHVFQLLQQVANENYKGLLHISDDPADVVKFVRDHPPKQSAQSH